eukprot:SM000016S01900  [mRNA]  locus=s16:432517:439919:- [translate_table: standard]
MGHAVFEAAIAVRGCGGTVTSAALWRGTVLVGCSDGSLRVFPAPAAAAAGEPSDGTDHHRGALLPPSAAAGPEPETPAPHESGTATPPRQRSLRAALRDGLRAFKRGDQAKDRQPPPPPPPLSDAGQPPPLPQPSSSSAAACHNVTGFATKAVVQLDVVDPDGLLLHLADGVGLHALPGLEAAAEQLDETRGAYMYAWDGHAGRLCVVKDRRLLLYKLDCSGRRFTDFHEQRAPGPVQAAAWCGPRSLCLGLGSKYVLMDADDGSVIVDAAPCSRPVPCLAVPLGSGSGVLLQQDVAGVVLSVDGRAESGERLEWQEAPIAVTVSPPYAVGLLHSGTVEVRLHASTCRTEVAEPSTMALASAVAAMVTSSPVGGRVVALPMFYLRAAVSPLLTGGLALCQVRLLEPPFPLVQTLVVADGLRLLAVDSATGAVLASSSADVHLLTLVPLEQQVEQLEASNNYEEALSLCKHLPLEERPRAEAHVHASFGQYLFRKGDYTEALAQLASSLPDLSAVLALYPDICQVQPAQNDDGVGDPSTVPVLRLPGSLLAALGGASVSDNAIGGCRANGDDGASSPQQALQALRSYLLQKRLTVLEAAEAVAQAADRAGAVPVPAAADHNGPGAVACAKELGGGGTAAAAATLLDTALLQVHLKLDGEGGGTPATEHLLRGQNFCDAAVSEAALVSAGRRDLLVPLFWSRGLHKRALAVLRESAAESSHADGDAAVQAIVTYLRKLGPAEQELVLESSTWLLTEHPQLALNLLRSTKPAIASGVVADHLERHAPALLPIYLEAVLRSRSSERKDPGHLDEVGHLPGMPLSPKDRPNSLPSNTGNSAIYVETTDALQAYREGAERGVAQDQYDLGLCYERGRGVAADPCKAAAWYRRAAEGGHAKAQCNLGVLYELGEGVVPDAGEAAAWHRRAAEQGIAQAQFNLGASLEHGRGVAQDATEALRWYRAAAEQGNAPAMVCLAMLCCDWAESGVPEDHAEGIRLLQASTARGHAESQYRLGDCYYEGKGVKKDLLRATELYRKAAEQGQSGAAYNLGVCYKHGRGVEASPEQAAVWYHCAAEAGHMYAQFNLGASYERGRGVPKDAVTAVQWYRLSAAQGCAMAQCNLGACLASGRGCERDEVEAVEWYRAAAEQGVAVAQNKLGACYDEGKGCEVDMVAATSWYQRAAEQGLAAAQLNLGMCHATGKGVAQDWGVAMSWYRAAAEQGDAEAQYCLGLCHEQGLGLAKRGVVAMQHEMREAMRWYQAAADQGHEAALEQMMAAALKRSCHGVGVRGGKSDPGCSARATWTYRACPLEPQAEKAAVVAAERLRAAEAPPKHGPAAPLSDVAAPAGADLPPRPPRPPPQTVPVNPKPFLNDLTGKPLASTEEFIDGEFTGNLGEVLIRCNNVLYLRGVPEDEEIAEAEADEQG